MGVLNRSEAVLAVRVMGRYGKSTADARSSC